MDRFKNLFSSKICPNSARKKDWVQLHEILDKLCTNRTLKSRFQKQMLTKYDVLMAGTYSSSQS